MEFYKFNSDANEIMAKHRLKDLVDHQDQKIITGKQNRGILSSCYFKLLNYFS